MIQTRNRLLRKQILGSTEKNWAKVKAPPTPSVLVVGKTEDDDKNKENV